MIPPNTGLEERSANFLSLEYLAEHWSELKSYSLAGSYHCTCLVSCGWHRVGISQYFMLPTGKVDLV